MRGPVEVALIWMVAFVVGSLSVAAWILVAGWVSSKIRRAAAYRRDRHLLPMPGELWDHEGRAMLILAIHEEGPVVRLDGGLRFETWGDWRAESARVRRFRAHGPEMATHVDAFERLARAGRLLH